MKCRRLLQRYVLGLVLLASGCGTTGGQLPVQSTGADIRGTITQVNQNTSGDIIGALLVKGALAPDTRYDNASITITTQTVILEQKGQTRRPVTFADFQVGQQVQAEFTGPVAESYPVQGRAREVIILK